MHHGKFGNMLRIYKGKRVYVIGHTGFKGTWLIALLDRIGALTGGYSLLPNSTTSHFDLIGNNNNSTIGDISDIESLEKSILAFKPEIIFHLAAQPLVRESYKVPHLTYQTNVMGTLNVLNAVRSCASVEAVVVITTDKVYENKEWVYPYREEDELGGYDMYSSSKACSEILVKSFIRSFFNINDYNIKHNVLIATARAGNVIGGGDWSNDRLIPDMIRAAIEKETTKIRNPNSVRPWQHVLDCLFGYLLLGEKLLKKQTEFASVWNFAPHSFDVKSVSEVGLIAGRVWKDILLEVEISKENLHEATLLKLDNTKALTELGWKPQLTTEAAIEKTIEWYMEFYRNNKVLTQFQINEYLLLHGI